MSWLRAWWVCSSVCECDSLCVTLCVPLSVAMCVSASTSLHEFVFDYAHWATVQPGTHAYTESERSTRTPSPVRVPRVTERDTHTHRDTSHALERRLLDLPPWAHVVFTTPSSIVPLHMSRQVAHTHTHRQKE